MPEKEMLREIGRKMIISFPLKLYLKKKNDEKKNEHKFAPNTLQK